MRGDLPNPNLLQVSASTPLPQDNREGGRRMRIDEVYGIAPGLARKLEEQNICLLSQLAGANDIASLSERTQIPVNRLEELCKWAKAKEYSSPTRRKMLLGIGIFITVSLLILRS